MWTQDKFNRVAAAVFATVLVSIFAVVLWWIDQLNFMTGFAEGLWWLQTDVLAEQVSRLSALNAERARNMFSVFRRTIRPGMLWGPFVGDLTSELNSFYKDFIAGTLLSAR